MFRSQSLNQWRNHAKLKFSVSACRCPKQGWKVPAEEYVARLKKYRGVVIEGQMVDTVMAEEEVRREMVVGVVLERVVYVVK